MELVVSLIGKVGRDPETRYTQDGKAVTTISVATNPYFGAQKEKTVWVKVTAWQGLAETVQKFVKKGMLVKVEGTPQTDDNGLPRTYEASDGKTKASNLEVTARDIKFLSRVQPQEEVQSDQSQQEVDLGEEIPFR